MQPSQYAQLVPALALKGGLSESLDGHEEVKIQVYKLFTRVWSGYCRALSRDVIERGKAIMCPVFGIFAQKQALWSPG